MLQNFYNFLFGKSLQNYNKKAPIIEFEEAIL